MEKTATKSWTEQLSPWVTVGLCGMLLAMGLLSTKMVVDVTRAADLRAASYRRLSAVRQVISLLNDAEGGKRAYVITRRDEFLRPYTEARNELDSRLSELRRLTSDDPRQATYARVLESLARDQLEQMREAIAAPPAAAVETAARLVDSERDRQLIAAVRTVTGAMEHADLEMLKMRIAQFDRQRTESLITLWTLTGIAFFGTAAAAWQLTRDMRRLRRKEGVLQFEASHDALTGLYNRRRFEQALREASTSSPPVPFALVIADLDRFKQVNDTLGHPAGDQVLQVVAARLRDGFRDIDTVARMGGEEFAVLLRGLDASAAWQVADRVRESIAAQPINLTGANKGRTVAITISMGLALFPEDGSSETMLIDAADGAMYAAKEAGRNRTLAAGAAARPSGVRAA
jgi:diguanylate cyclase (GGDEF)-like protein